MANRIRKAVFPAAGYGTRFLPATKAMPKEMLPIVDKPVIQYLVEEAVESGIEEIVIITGKGKRAIEDHFDQSFELEHILAEKGKSELLKKIRKISNLAKFIYVRQPMPLGDGHAIMQAKEIIGDEPFAVLFGDDIVEDKKPALKQLIEVYEKTSCSVIGLKKISKKDSNKYGIVKSRRFDGRIHHLEDMIEKPDPKDAPSDLAIIGKYICTPEIFDAMKKSKPSRDGEIRLIDGFLELIKTQQIYGYEIEGKRFDTGDIFGFIQATLHYALKRKDIKEQLTKHIKNLDIK